MIMAHDVETIRDELHGLLGEQTNALKVQTFGGLSNQEWHEFEARRERIHDLTVLLLALTTPEKPAA
jgi:hypothetical protein